MSIKGFFLLMVTVIAIGGSIGGAFSGGLALGRSQHDDALPETAVLQQQFAGGQSSSGGLAGGAFAGGQLSGGDPDGQRFRDGQGFRSTGEDHTSPDGPSGFGGGAFSRNVLSGTIGAVDGNLITVTTDSGETQVNLRDDSTIQIYGAGTLDDLSPGDRVLVIVSGDVESGEPLDAASVIVNPPEGAGIFGRGAFGSRSRGP